MGEIILISACLLGKDCRYDGRSKLDKNVLKFAKVNKTIPVCPEVLSGLPTPRPTAEITGGDGNDVLDNKASVMQIKTGAEVTAQFIKGAEKVLKLCEDNNIRLAIFKERSPSCGVRQIYRNGIPVDGMGVTTAALVRKGIKVFSEENVSNIQNVSDNLK